jgi:hypothetical protein
MSNPSNLYAEKIFSEHPMALWALDEKLDYISLISEEQRDLVSLWDAEGCSFSQGIDLTGEPFIDSYTTKVSCNVPIGSTNEAVFKSPEIVNFSDLEQSLGSFCISTYFYSNTTYLNSIYIGYEYTDTTTSNVIQKLKKFETTIFQEWGFISETFEIPNENTNCKIVIKVVTNSGGDNINDYEVYFNGITFGQWSEEFNVSSLGTTYQTFPENIELSTTASVIEAPAYGISSDIGYYLVNGNSLVAKNTGIPLVFGASNITKLTPNINDEPSFIFPGKGFLHETGRNKDYTIEFWARINSDTTAPKRIFGPIASNDGLYVEGGFLTLFIGGNFSSYFVGEWFRPMLIDIRVIADNATVLLNGEQVISLDFVTSSISLPSLVGEDWIGFYAYENVSPVEIDCVAIYSYQVPEIIAKRRYVYGQGVGSAENIDASYGGTSALIDYSFADYTANYKYPDFARWEQGTFDNLTTTATALKPPTYQLPEIFLETKTQDNLYSDCKLIQSETNSFITFRPTETWDNVSAYLNFPKFNVLSDEVHSIYGVFKITENDLSKQILFKIYNSLTGNFFTIKKDGPNIDYYLTYNGIEEDFYSIENFQVGQLVSVGINFSKIVENFGGNIAAFFGEKSGLKMYVGGDDLGQETFTGNIYSVGLSTEFNSTKIQDHFTENGFAIFDSAQTLIDHTASYTLLPTQAYGKLFLDIGVSGYWEDYMPLSYFGQNIINDAGNSFYDLDFLQFNIGYPSSPTLLERESTGSWTYEDLDNEYSSLVQKTYSQIDNSLLTGWKNYEDVKQKALKYYEYNTEDAAIRSYVTFQYISEGANLPQDNFITTVSPKENGVIDISDYSSWTTTKFEVVDNTIIYPRKDIDFNSIAIVYHLDFNIRGTLTKPVLLRKLEVASQALDDNSFNPIGTRLGTSLFPYKKSGIYYDYKSKNPFTIYKGSTPYLYMNRTSGIQVRGDFDFNFDRGISMPVNQFLAENYRVSALQSWIRYDQSSFTATPISLFEVAYKNDTIIFYIVANDKVGNRGRIYAKNKRDNSDFQGISYYVNGKLVREPVLTLSEWSVLGINFGTALDFDLFRGSINLNSPAIFNNISYYQANNLQQVQSKITRPWIKVQNDGVSSKNWAYWLNNYTWEGMLIISASALYGVNAQEIYNNFMGTNKIVIDDDSGVIFDADKMKIYNDTTWSISVGTPV